MKNTGNGGSGKSHQQPSGALPPTTKTVVEVEVRTSIETDSLEESHVYVHCYFNNSTAGMLIRIWRSTFLIDGNGAHRSSLIHAENISFAPEWTMVPDNRRFHFLLVFEGLPRSCKLFDLLEEIPQAGGFHVKDIHRNEMDVYHVNLV